MRAGGVRVAAAGADGDVGRSISTSMPIALLGRALADGLVALRGVAMVVLAPLFALAVSATALALKAIAQRRLPVALAGRRSASISRVTVLATGFVAAFGGELMRGSRRPPSCSASTAALLIAAPRRRGCAPGCEGDRSPSICSSHRYDYRAEWLRFTETLGAPRRGAPPLDVRVVKAIADITDSPAGCCCCPTATGLGAAARVELGRARRRRCAADAALVAPPRATGRIIELDAVRGGADAGDGALVPGWMLRPIATRGRSCRWSISTGWPARSLLARPPVDRALDWEDFDLLALAGRQVASYLAEARGQEALADARRFDEFNRRFAFIMHDIKNLVSQLSLVARNAERHADNPEFRADMIATLQARPARMNDLLARLSQHHRAARSEPRPVVARPRSRERDRRARGARSIRSSSTATRATRRARPIRPRLEQALGHLVQNAIDASAADAPVRDPTRPPQAATAAIEVIDRGHGMSPDFIRDQPVPAVRLDQAGRLRHRRVRGAAAGRGDGRPARGRRAARARAAASPSCCRCRARRRARRPAEGRMA